MNKVLAIAFCLFSLSGMGQAHLGVSESSIKNRYPDNVWKTDYTKTGTRYISTDFFYGEFTYYFSKETGLTYHCIQIPFNIGKLNGQVEAYNKKYVITSDTSWTAYLNDGGIMYIVLKYDSESKLSIFTYSDTK